jgi:hypothetical protein
MAKTSPKPHKGAVNTLPDKKPLNPFHRPANHMPVTGLNDAPKGSKGPTK